MIISNAQAKKVLPHLQPDDLSAFYEYALQKEIKAALTIPQIIEELLASPVFEQFLLFEEDMPLEVQEALIDACSTATGGIHFNRNIAFDSSKLRRRGLGKLIQDEILCGELDHEVILARVLPTPEGKDSTAKSNDVAFVKTQLRKAGFVVPIKPFPRKRKAKILQQQAAAAAKVPV